MLLWGPKENRPLGRPKRRWDDNIKMNLQEVASGGMNWIYVTHDRDRWRAVVNAVMTLRVPLTAEDFLTSWGTVSFSGRTLLR